MADPIKWNELVPEKNRLESPNWNPRRSADLIPTHIVVHVTGTNSLASVKKIFLAKDSVSAHYLIIPQGDIFQFVPDASRAWHAGIDSNSRVLYRKELSTWSRYLKYFSWYKGYSKNAIFVDGDTKPVWDRTEACFVARNDGQPWPEYAYFTSRWPNEQFPVNFAADADPNNYSIGIELLGFGAKTSDPTVYTDEMYTALDTLTRNLSAKYDISRKKGRVVGHEDVHPVGRFGWDPSAGFDWSVIHHS